MRPNITIVIPDPYIPLDAYCRRTGMSRSTAENLISYGKLPIKPKGAQKKGLVEVNMVTLTVMALSECDVSLNTYFILRIREELTMFDYQTSKHAHFDAAC